MGTISCSLGETGSGSNLGFRIKRLENWCSFFHANRAFQRESSSCADNTGLLTVTAAERTDEAIREGKIALCMLSILTGSFMKASVL